MSVRAVLDTNVLVSGFAFPQGVPGELLRLLGDGVLVNVVSEYILEELDRVLGKITGMTITQRTSVVQMVIELSELVSPTEGVWVKVDPRDDPIVGTAMAGGATVLVTGDKPLSRLRQIGTLEIESPRVFLDRLTASK